MIPWAIGALGTALLTGKSRSEQAAGGTARGSGKGWIQVSQAWAIAGGLGLVLFLTLTHLREAQWIVKKLKLVRQLLFSGLEDDDESDGDSESDHAGTRRRRTRR